MSDSRSWQRFRKQRGIESGRESKVSSEISLKTRLDNMQIGQAMALPQSAFPGQSLGSVQKYSSGNGTHVHESSICASLVGSVASSKQAPSTSPPHLLSVSTNSLGAGLVPSRNVTKGNTLPKVNSVVLAKVTRLQQRQILVSILVVDDAVCADSFQGIVRKEDVRGWEVDKVVLGESFRVGDIIRAVVISLGDQISYYLSTAKNELGVLMATSEAGNQMHPISWKEFRDPETGKKEQRKAAKPV